jgi:membrane protease YdiL (CAAX protease family)
VTGGIVTPLIEEVIVRFGLLRAILQHTSSGKTAVMTTSVLFALAHVGLPTWPPAIPYFSNAAWLFLASLLVGHLTVRSAGNITIALTAHLSRNALEFCLLLAAAL